MPGTSDPELPPIRQAALNPRLRRGGAFFTDEKLRIVAHVLDEWFRIPGTSIRFGLDGIVGLIPGLGDILAGLASCILIAAAWVRGVPYVTLIRMLVNLGLEVVIGTVPILGDAFDIAWKANRRNYRLLIRHLEQPRRQTWRDWVFLLLMALALFTIFLAPVLLALWLLDWLRRRL